MSEPTIFSEGSIQITRRRIVVENQQFTLDDINSVQIDTAKLPRIGVVLGIIVGAAAVGVSQANGSLIWLVAGAALLAIVGFLWWRANRTYILVLGTAKGEQQVLISRDRQFIDRAAQSIDSLLVARGRRL